MAQFGQVPNSSQCRSMSASRSNCERRLPSSFVWVFHIQNHGIGAGVPKVIDDFGLLPEVVVQRSPLRSD